MTKAQILELKDIEAQISELKKKADAIKDEMKAEMGNEEHVEVEGFKVNYTIVISTTLDSTKLKKELPDLWNKYKKEGMFFEVEHSRVPKDGSHLPYKFPLFMSDMFDRFDNARNFARCLLRREPNHPYIREASKKYWFFNINVFSVENGVRTLLPVEDWQDLSSNGTEELSTMLDYCSEVAAIKGERDILKEEVDRLKTDLDKSHAEIKRLNQIISASATMLESQMNALKGLTED